MDMTSVVIMNFSGIYREQKFYRDSAASWLNMEDIPGTNCYCDEDAMESIRERIADYPAGGIHFIDSGNYHYLTRIWIEKMDKPFRLLVFDNHTDMQPPAFGGLLSCGGWIRSALEELPLLSEVILVGPDEEAFSRVEPEFQKKVRFLSRESLASMKEEELRKFFGQIFPGLPVYISIDKDVLNCENADTNWSQGDMSLPVLLECIREVMQSSDGEISGVDVCGECDSTEGGDICLNDRANREILEFLTAGSAQ